MEDAILIEQYLEGDEEGLAAIYDRYAGVIYGYLCRRVGPTEAEDLLQETFVKVATSLESYTHKGRLRSWLLTIARSKMLDRLRSAQHQRERNLAEDEGMEISAMGNNPLEEEENRELGRRICEAVAQLPDNQREIFLLREESGLSFKEIGDLLGIPLNTALSHMHRATATLRAALADLEPEATG